MFKNDFSTFPFRIFTRGKFLVFGVGLRRCLSGISELHVPMIRITSVYFTPPRSANLVSFNKMAPTLVIQQFIQQLVLLFCILVYIYIYCDAHNLTKPPVENRLKENLTKHSSATRTEKLQVHSSFHP